MNRQMVIVLQAASRFLHDMLGVWDSVSEEMPDGRKPRGIRWALGHVLGNLLLGKLLGLRSLRGVEFLTDMCQGASSTAGTFGGRRMSDSTAHNVLEATGEESMSHVLVKFGQHLHRQKMLSPVRTGVIQGKAVHVVGYDGQKSIKSDEPQPSPYHRKSHTVKEKEGEELVQKKRDYWIVGAANAVLTSSAAPVCLGQKTIVDGNENAAVLALDKSMTDNYRWLRPGEVLKLADALHGTVDFFAQQGNPYDKAEPGHFAGTTLKGTNKLIYKEAIRATNLRMLTKKADATTKFERSGHNRWVKRELFLVETNRAFGKSIHDARDNKAEWAILDEEQWPTITLIACVKQTTRYKNAKARDKVRQIRKQKARGEEQSTRHEQAGDLDIEYRYFQFNIKRKDVRPADVLVFVRKLWEIESYHNHLVQVMNIKSGDWATLNQAPIAMIALCAIAMNLVGLFRQRRLRQAGGRLNISYPQLIQVFTMVLAAHVLKDILPFQEKPATEETTDDLGEDTLEELYQKRFSGKELETIMFLMKKVVARALKDAKSWLTKKISVFTAVLEELPLLSH